MPASRPRTGAHPRASGARLDAVRAEWDVLAHPFYQRWSRGELLRDELAAYSGQYRHAVTGLARGSASAAAHADGELHEHLESTPPRRPSTWSSGTASWTRRAATDPRRRCPRPSGAPSPGRER